MKDRGDDMISDNLAGLNHHTNGSINTKFMDSRSTTTKRDRPLSSYFDSPSNTKPMEVSDYFSLKGQGINHLQINDERGNETEDNYEFTSPLVNKKPFRNLSNFVNNLEFASMKKKFSSSKKSLTRSMTLVAKYSNKELEKNISREDEVENKLQNELDDDTNNGLNNTGGSPTQMVSRNKSIRRFHSMCQTTKEKETYNMEDNSHLSKTLINTFKVDNDLLPRINEDELFKILNGDYMEEFDEYIIVDCRFNYEYEGGHIINAINITSQQGLEEKFVKNKTNDSNSKRQLYIFHCEFSIFRSPTMASHLRKCDRILNSNNYPKLTYPDIVVLEGGYKRFYDKYKSQCYPQAYVEMKDVNHQKTCEQEMGKVRQAKKLPRAKSYNHFLGNNSLSNTHNRSNSFTTITSHAENLKILKRQRSTSKFNLNNNDSDNETFMPGAQNLLGNRLTRASTFTYTPSIFNSSPTNSPNIMSNRGIDSDFQPPSAFFKLNGHQKSSSNSSNFSSSSISINSSSSSICSDLAFSSTDSLTDSYSPVGELSEFFEPKANSLTNYLKNNAKNSSYNHLNTDRPSLINPLTREPSGLIPQLPAQQRNKMSSCSSDASTPSDTTIVYQNSKNLPKSSFKFPLSSKLKNEASRNLSRINTNMKHSSNSSLSNISGLPTAASSPIINSPLSTTTPISTIESSSKSLLSIIDPINDTPVDFSVPSSTKRPLQPKRGSASILSSGGGTHPFLDLDIDEEEEEEIVEDNDRTLTEIKLNNKLSNFIQKSPFN